MMKLYVGCALTHASEEFRQEVESVKEALRKDSEVMDFLGLVDGTAGDVYEWDINNCVKNCNIFVAIVDYPSLGLGYEMATAIEKPHKPTLALAQTDSKVGRIIWGINQPHYRFSRYASLSEIPSMVQSFVEEQGA